MEEARHYVCKKADYHENTVLGGNPRESCGKVARRGRGGRGGEKKRAEGSMPVQPYLFQPSQSKFQMVSEESILDIPAQQMYYTEERRK